MQKIKVTDPKQRQDILEDSREEIKLHIERFNPSLNKSLFGYINTYIGAKVGTVAKKALKAPKTITTDKKNRWRRKQSYNWRNASIR